jgi:hypothetical protein
MVRCQLFPKSIVSLCQNRSVCKTRRICRQLAVNLDFAFIGNGFFSMNLLEDVKRYLQDIISYFHSSLTHTETAIPLPRGLNIKGMGFPVGSELSLCNSSLSESEENSNSHSILRLTSMPSQRRIKFPLLYVNGYLELKLSII